ncbi:ABC transporter substrate-binding protein [Kushneria aurantia]|uniref:ABC transporter substrate-binding protein n=1 Tax=Kushneria aurantia TaxID=504092 RepID=A0ABV6FZS4_9GAMM|nr:ABC transporter substrate-binding protein [Kushneria aurantia]
MTRYSRIRQLLSALALFFVAIAPAKADIDTLRFGVSPWPGVTVKTEIASQLLQALGYRTQKNELAVSVIINALSNDQLDVYLGNWYPVQEEMTRPHLDEGTLVQVAKNISDAESGLVVPQYVHEAGVDSVADLNRYRDRFNAEIQGIEAGTGINDAILAAIDNNRAGLGDWQLNESSTAAMLALAQQKISNREWITFVGWEPHWMNVSYDLYYLKDADDSGIASITSTVWTLARRGLEAEAPNLYRFLSQYRVAIEDQNDWVYEYNYRERPADEVASEWIRNHPDTVAQWLDGVTSRSGEAAIDVVREKMMD